MLVVIIVILIAFIKGDWRNWEQYYPTVLYTSLASFLYEFISHSHFHLWELGQDHIFNLMNIHYVHNLMINPLVAMVYLSNFPSNPKKKITYVLKWIVVFLLIEWLAFWMVLVICCDYVPNGVVSSCS